MWELWDKKNQIFTIQSFSQNFTNKIARKTPNIRVGLAQMCLNEKKSLHSKNEYKLSNKAHFSFTNSNRNEKISKENSLLWMFFFLLSRFSSSRAILIILIFFSPSLSPARLRLFLSIGIVLHNCFSPFVLPPPGFFFLFFCASTASKFINSLLLLHIELEKTMVEEIEAAPRQISPPPSSAAIRFREGSRRKQWHDGRFAEGSTVTINQSQSSAQQEKASSKWINHHPSAQI